MKVQNRSFHGNGKNGTIGTESGESGTASRRSFIHGLGAGFGSLALEGILQAENPASSHLTKALPHIAPKAKSCIFLFMFLVLQFPLLFNDWLLIVFVVIYQIVIRGWEMTL